MRRLDDVPGPNLYIGPVRLLTVVGESAKYWLDHLRRGNALGIQPGSAEWGSMIAGGQAGIVTGQWWISFFPGMGILLLATALHLIGDGISDDDLVCHGH